MAQQGRDIENIEHTTAKNTNNVKLTLPDSKIIVKLERTIRTALKKQGPTKENTVE